ncbi:MAG: cbb3-type cytochrome c oxidase subunit I [Burkholderiales bacterium]|jgi:cytochrome c oxidase subunit 1|uniref:Cytochrome C oxidase subunit I n=1 Tax=Candidatus Desulfobacillus denitrificans TaxID=2608985 RepID=A0A809RUY2_9PROT|nr:cbb3-type cytochrome c oxidase subunit I [Zoogloeaceae bacterium]MBP9653659.1 cbb3-type cytochrome c oxidase subunit I [Rhodocyclaceae bacterium]MCZ2173482.1 cbb3-type cytochrome c oxidase subunit I [Burkholderiales bacterium]BBO20217.1 cytochrome C oxidase subunit I [Candidatus Desulfobacillus denitrificans]GIK44711.1 MAG: cytochrome c oxidase subunit I [Betaproteobacteria bacterium]
MATTYRICPRSGLQFDTEAEKLMRFHAVCGVLSLLVGGIMALGVILTRWPAVHLLSADVFYMVLTAHGIDMLIFWIIFFEMAVLIFASSTLLHCRLATPKLAWLSSWLMVLGAIMTNVAIFQGESSVMFTSYVPMQAKWHFYLGLILFAVGALLICFIFLGTLVVAKAEKTYEGSIPLVTFGALTACIIAIFTIASGAIILIPTFFWSIGYIREIDSLMYRVVWWGLGHSSQQINVSAHVAIWYAIAAIVFGAKPMSEKVSRTAYFLYILFLQLASAHHILSDPGMSSEWKIVNTSYFMYFAVLASMIHGMTVPGAIEQAQRLKGYNKGLFEWLRKAPWGNPAFSSMFLSLIGFGFLGGISGVMMGAEQLNMLIHNTIYVPGHFHATVVIGTTLAFMGLTYFLVPVLFKREVLFPGFAKIQPYLFGLAMYIVSLVMMGAGTLGVSRRHWDMAFAGAPMAYEWPGAAYLMMGLTGIFGVVAIVGGAGWILQIVLSIFFGKKLEEGEIRSTPIPLTLPPPAPAGAAHPPATPGTMVLALIFLTAFILYYFVNWKYLSSLWGLS